MVKNPLITFLQDKLLGTWWKLTEWNSPRCSQIDRKPKSVVSVNSATYSITGFQKNNLEYVNNWNASQKGFLIFVKQIQVVTLHHQQENMTQNNTEKYLEGCISERISSSKTCKPTTNNNSWWCVWLSPNIFTIWTWKEDKICFISVKVTQEIIFLVQNVFRNTSWVLFIILNRKDKFKKHF